MIAVVHILFVIYWRDFHFYFAHRYDILTGFATPFPDISARILYTIQIRVMHPWFNIKYGLMDGDVGAWLYRVAHSLHHKSHNPGPWSGLSMHPIEHLIYYSCTLTPLVWTLHPIHFLFNKFHADVSPLPGHDGYDKPGGGSYFHYLHHGA